MNALLIIGTLATLAALTGYLARVLHQRDQARIAAGLARMELRATRVRLAEMERTLGLIDSNAAESPEWIRERIRAGGAQ